MMGFLYGLPTIYEVHIRFAIYQQQDESSGVLMRAQDRVSRQ